MPKGSSSAKVSGSKRSSVTKGATLETGLASPDFFLPFFHYLVIPKNTSQTGYVNYVLPLPISQVFRVWTEFPRGCSGLVGMQLWRGVEQIFPLPHGTWLRSDGIVISFAFTHMIDREPYEIEVRGYNLDDTYQHTIWIGLELRGLPSELSEQMASFLTALKG